MSYNGSGTFNINSTGQPVVAGTVITASAFNSLTTDLATGLTTAITKDGQTTTTARITFAQGITSSLVTDSSSVSTGSIITAGGVGIAKALFVGTTANVAGAVTLGGIATFSAQPIFSSLTASSAVATDASKGLVSVTNTGTGNNVLATSPTITTPTISSLSSAAATALTLQSAGTTAVTIDTSQNVGVGTASPAYKLNIVQAKTLTPTTGDGQIAIDNSTAGQVSAVLFSSQGTRRAQISSGMGGSGNDGYLALTTRSDSTGFNEAARIESSGNLLVGGTTSVTGRIQGFSANATSIAISAISQTSGDVGQEVFSCRKFDNNTTTSQVFQRFTINNGAAGSGQINANGAGAAAFGAFSDSRLKENIIDLPSQLSNIMALRPVEFDYIESEGGGHQIGFIAQEVNEIYSDLVGERADGMFTLTDMNKNDARLIKCIQEMKSLIDTQAETINALTARIVALENA
jgi:hypothetical protein